MKTYSFDYLIIGSGIAGLSAARVLAKAGSLCVITKHAIQEGATQYAQGGIAVAMQPDDSPALHFQDTLKAGDGLCREEAVKILVEEAPIRIQELIDLGVQFDKQEGHFHFTQEAAHSRRRILHAGDATGKEIEKTLARTLPPDITVLTHTFLLKLLVKDGVCFGCIALHQGQQIKVLAKAVVLSTGGCGQLFLHNTNPSVSTADGIALAYEAGAAVEDMEFIQFHPTTLYQDKEAISRFLISEAVRGEGAVLLNSQGERFMPQYHPEAELAPRDVVARAIFDQMRLYKADYVYLDARAISQSQTRFPTIYARCLDVGFDMCQALIPVSPAAHYCMGGIQATVWGQTTVERLYAIGECAAMGLHGANRLASNSLLDGLVFGYRAAQHILNTSFPLLTITEQDTMPLTAHPLNPEDIQTIKKALRHLMWTHVGIVRHQSGLEQALDRLQTWQIPITPDQAVAEVRHMVKVAQLITEFALQRTESRGSHFRSDFPLKKEGDCQQHQVFSNHEVPTSKIVL